MFTSCFVRLRKLAKSRDTPLCCLRRPSAVSMPFLDCKKCLAVEPNEASARLGENS